VVDLKFSLLPKKSTVKVTIELPKPLKEELDAYAAEIQQASRTCRNQSFDTARPRGARPCGSRLATSRERTRQAQPVDVERTKLQRKTQ
jgi:hypothetical protein